MSANMSIRVLFCVSGVYDGVLGVAFLFFPLAIFGWADVTPPNHVGYAQFPAALLIVFAIMFINIARHPLRCRNLIPYGVLLKISYCGIVGLHWAQAGVPTMWKPFFVADVLMAVLFVWAYWRLERGSAESPHRTVGTGPLTRRTSD